MGDSEKEMTGSEFVDNKSIEEVTVEDMAAKTAKPAKKKSASHKDSFFTGVKTEFKKVVWPNRQSLIKQTAAVLLSSVALGIIITIVDIIIRFGLELIVK